MGASEVTLGGSERSYITVRIPHEEVVRDEDGSPVLDGDKLPKTEQVMGEYRVPLYGSLSIGELLEVDEAMGMEGSAFVRGFMAFLSHYIPRDVLGTITAADIAAFSEAWNAASEADGTDKGE